MLVVVQSPHNPNREQPLSLKQRLASEHAYPQVKETTQVFFSLLPTITKDDCWWSRGRRSATHQVLAETSYVKISHGRTARTSPVNSPSVPKYCAMQSVGGELVRSDRTVRSVMNVAAVASLPSLSPSTFITKFRHLIDWQKARTSSSIGSAARSPSAERLVARR